MPRHFVSVQRIEWKWRNLYRPATQPTVGSRLPCAPAPASPVGVVVSAPAPPARGAGVGAFVVGIGVGRS